MGICQREQNVNNVPAFGGSPLKGITLNTTALLTPEAPVCSTDHLGLMVKPLAPPSSPKTQSPPDVLGPPLLSRPPHSSSTVVISLDPFFQDPACRF